MSKCLALIPARGGSKTLPGKNVRPFCGIPLLAHTIKYAKTCHSLADTVVSTDSDEIAAVAREYGATVLMRDPALARDETPIWAVIRDSLERMEAINGPYDYVALLEVTSPLRTPGSVDCALPFLESRPDADGIMAVSRFNFNPEWNSFVIDEAGFLQYLVSQGQGIWRRQMAREIVHHSGELYVFRASFVREQIRGYQGGYFLHYPTPWQQACSIDTLEDFEWAEQLVEKGLVKLPWLERTEAHDTY